MGGELFQPLLQDFGNQVADGPALVAAAGSDCSNQAAGQVDRENGFGLRHRPQHEVALRLEKVAVSLAAGDAHPIHQSRQNRLGGLLSMQHSNGHIDSLRLSCQRGASHYAV